jgi:hypothetical protein
MLVLFGQSSAPSPRSIRSFSTKRVHYFLLGQALLIIVGRRQLQQPRHKSVKLGCTEIAEAAHRTYLSLSEVVENVGNAVIHFVNVRFGAPMADNLSDAATLASKSPSDFGIDTTGSEALFYRSIFRVSR